jgi:hypothetical protein
MEEPRDIRDYLIGMRFPASKQQLVEAVQVQGATRFVVRLFEHLPEREYASAEDVTGELTTIG